MQTYTLSQPQKSVKIFLAFMLTMSFSTATISISNAEEFNNVMDKDIKLKFNGKEINQKGGIHFSEIKKDEANLLLIEIQSECFDSNPKLRIFLAKGTRPITMENDVDISTQPGINLSKLLSQAKSGDRIILDFNNDERIIVIPIS